MTMALTETQRPVARSGTLTSLWPLFLMITVGAAIRFFGLGEQSIWYDEAYSIDLASQPFQTIIDNIQSAYLPLHYLFLRIWILLMGQSEVSVRLLSLVFGVATIPSTYVLGKRMFNSWIGLVGSAMVAISPFLVYYSQETKAYSLLGFQAVITTYLLLRALDGNRSWWLAYALVAVTMVYTHYYGVLFLGAQSVFTLVWFLSHVRAESTRRTMLAWVGAEVFVAALFLPWALVRMSVFETFISADASASVGEFMFWKTVIAFTVGQSLGTLNPSLISPIHYHDQELAATLAWGPLLVAALGIIRVLPWFREGRHGDSPARVSGAYWRSWLLIMIIIVVTGLAVYVASVNRRGYDPRYLITLAPLFYLLIAWGCDFLRHKAKPLLIPVAAFIFGVMLFSLSNYYFDPTYAREDFRSATAYIEEHVQPNDAVICNTDYSQLAIGYYLNDGTPLVGLPAEVPMDETATEKGLAQLASRYQRLWLVLWQDYYSDPEGHIHNWLTNHTIPTGGQKSFHGGIRVQRFLTTPPIVDAASVPNPRSDVIGRKIALLGYDFSTPKSGEEWPITWYFRALTPLNEDYTLFMHLIGPGNQAWTQHDTQPYSGGYPTSQWEPGKIIKVETSLNIPAFSPPVDYRLELGLYDSATSEVLTGPNGDRIVFEPVKISAGTGVFPPSTTACEYDFAGQMGLCGYKIEEINGGESLTVITYWQSLAETRNNHTISIQLVDQQGNEITQKEASPGLSSYPTGAWPQGQTVVDFEWLQLPPELPSGKYSLVIGVKDSQSGQNLQAKPNWWSQAQNHVELASIVIN